MYEKVFACLEEKLEEKDYLLNMYREENGELKKQAEELKKQVDKLCEKMKEAGLE